MSRPLAAGDSSGAAALAPVLLLTGGPAAGKSTTARHLARGRDRAALVEVDDVRRLVVAGGAAPWEGEEGRRQQLLGVENACDLAERFVRTRVDVVMTDVVDAGTVVRYRARLPHLVVVHLEASREEARRRAGTRPVHLTDGEFEALHDAQAAGPSLADHVVRVDGLSVQEQVDAVARAWRPVEAGTSLRPLLVLLNGLPGSGKTTLARRWVTHHPLAMALDVDTVRASLGRWEEHPGLSGLAARHVALAAARAHLTQGHDVVVPQLVARPRFLDELQDLAADVGARFVHVVLDVPPDVSARRTTGRAAADRSTPAVGVQEALEVAERLERLLGRRSEVVHLDGELAPDALLDGVRGAVGR